MVQVHERLKMAFKEFNYEPFEGIGPFGQNQHSRNPIDVLGNVLSRIIGILTLVAVIYFIFQVIFAGYTWISAGGDSQKVKLAQDKLWQSVLGLTIVIFAVAFVSLMGYLIGGVDLLDLNSIF